VEESLPSGALWHDAALEEVRVRVRVTQG